VCGGVYHQQWIEWRESKRQKPKELMMSRELKQQATLTQWVWAMARPIVMGERISRGGNKLMKKQSKGRRYARLHMTCMIESLFCQRAAWISVPTASDDTFSLLLFFSGFIVHFFLDFSSHLFLLSFSFHLCSYTPFFVWFILLECHIRYYINSSSLNVKYYLVHFSAAKGAGCCPAVVRLLL
jgi:hypothetical protein